MSQLLVHILMRFHLIDDWKQALRLKTVWVGAAIAILSVMQIQVLPLFQFAIPPGVFPWVTGVLGAMLIVLRHLEMPEGLPMSWKLHSVYMSGVLGALSMLQAQVLPLFAFAIPADVYPWITAVLGVAVVVARLLSQPGLAGGK